MEEARAGAVEKIRAICDAIGDASDCVERITVTEDLEEAVCTADFVIEAAPEKAELKQELFSMLVRFAPDHAVLSTNSSVIPVSTITAHLDDQDAARVVGVHFWNPPYLIQLVEVIEGERTSPDSVRRAMDLLTEVGKEAVHIKKDIVVGNRLQHALWREALALISAGAIDAPGVDTVIKKSFALRLPVLGPLENADLVGIELIQDVHRVVFPHLCNDSEPSPLLQEMLDAGTTGMRDGQGFYSWTPETAAEKRKELTDHLLKVTRG
jgi:3-hydroxybutyryl-CoA dehydrogenase